MSTRHLAVLLALLPAMAFAVNTHDPVADQVRYTEHEAMIALVPADAATAVARGGSWCDPAAWRGGVPAADDHVLVPEGVTVTVDCDTARLATIRVNGALEWADVPSRMVVDTLVVDTTGRLTIGTADKPITKPVEIVLAGPLDFAADPLLLGRGILAHGQTSIHGLEKTTHVKVATDPMAGDTSITLAAAPTNWAPGDTLVLAGTHFDGFRWDNAIRGKRYYPPEDEVLTISRLDGATVHFDTPLKFNHDSPRSDLKTSVANYTRSVTIRSEDETRRGHVMFMHSSNVDVRYAAFVGLGRTDKSERAIDVATDEASNLKGRYSVHLHRAGVGKPRQPAMLIGNAVFGSPGWGFVQHDSNAILHDNATYDTFGAGFVAETGNETGVWSDNIAIYAHGVDHLPKTGGDVKAFDLARTGDGFWFQGRMVEARGNIAASVNHGYVYLHRGPGMIKFDAALFDYPEAVGLNPKTPVDDVPILHFTDNEVFAADQGIHVVKANPNQGHDIHTHLKNFTAWNVQTGADITYTAHYLLENFDLVAQAPARFKAPKVGIILGKNATDMTVVGGRIAGFPIGVEAADPARFTFTVDSDHLGYTVIGTEITGAKTPISGPAVMVDPATLQPGRFRLSLEPLTYSEGTGAGDRQVAVRGTKTDSLGPVPIPAGSDNYDAKFAEVLRILERDGYWETPDGARWFVLKEYYSDRVTGALHKVARLVEIDPNVPLQNPRFRYRDAKFNGTIHPGKAVPGVPDVKAMTSPGTDVVIGLTSAPLKVDGIVQPEHGKVFDNGDGTVTYRPNIGFTGTDRFTFWATDGLNFTPASVDVAVAQPS